MLYHFAFRLAINKSFSCSTSLPPFSVISILGFGHSHRSGEISHCCFYVHFLDGLWYRTSFHMHIIHISSLVRCTLRSLAHFLFLLLSYMCIFNNSPLSVVHFINTVFVFHFLIHLILSVLKQEFLNFDKAQCIKYFFHVLYPWCCIWKVIAKHSYLDFLRYFF